MIPFGAVQVPGFSRRRNRQKLIEELKRARERAEMNQIEREVETSDVVNKAVEKGLPSEMADLVKHQLGVLTTGFMPEVPNEETWKRNELDQLADRFAGYYREKKADGWTSGPWSNAARASGISIRPSRSPSNLPAAGLRLSRAMRRWRLSGIFTSSASSKSKTRNVRVRSVETRSPRIVKHAGDWDG
jgi:hypothetical protein